MSWETSEQGVQCRFLFPWCRAEDLIRQVQPSQRQQEAPPQPIPHPAAPAATLTVEGLIEAYMETMTDRAASTRNDMILQRQTIR